MMLVPLRQDGLPRGAGQSRQQDQRGGLEPPPLRVQRLRLAVSYSLNGAPAHPCTARLRWGVVRDLRRRACTGGRRHFLSCRGPDELYKPRDRREYCGHVFAVAAIAAFTALGAFAAIAALSARLEDVRAAAPSVLTPRTLRHRRSRSRRVLVRVVPATRAQHVWQVLPLGPTGYGDSPYQCFSAFAGNPLLISLDTLVVEGLLNPDDVDEARALPADEVDYGRVIAHRHPLWTRALDRFDTVASPSAQAKFEAFLRAEREWLDDYALFMALKEAHHLVAWTNWDPAIAHREPAALDEWRTRCAREIRVHQFAQYLFASQWQALRQRCHEEGISMMGDIPIFVAHDSADVWARRDLFKLDDDGMPRRGGRRAAGLLQRDRPVVGQPALRLGRARARRATRGGSRGFARCWRRSTWSASITSAASRRHWEIPAERDDGRSTADG